MAEIFNVEDKAAAGLFNRSQARLKILLKSTMALVESYMIDGYTEAEAKDKVRVASAALTSNYPGLKWDFVLGDCAPLRVAIQAIVVVDFTQAKKDLVLEILNQAI